MLSLKQASNIRSFTFKIEDTTEDKVTISAVDYYGGIIFDKATTENPAYDFAIADVSVYSVANSSGVNTKRTVGNTVFINDTGYLGVVITAAAVGDIITFTGSFLAPTASNADDSNDIGSTIGGATPNLVNLGYSNDITLDSSMNPVYLQ